MSDRQKSLPDIRECYPILPSMLRKYDKFGRRDRFTGETAEDFRQWGEKAKKVLWGLLGLDKMESCPLDPVTDEVVMLPGDIRREHLRIQVEPEVWMPMYILIPAGASLKSRPFLCPPGHNGAGKYSVAGLREYGTVKERIELYRYDYGYQLARLGYVAVCPDCRGFGERREEREDAFHPELGMKGDCYWLAHMGEPLGIPVAGMLAWDLMRAVDYLYWRGEWDGARCGCLGFSGGGMQALMASALDERIRLVVISGYLYGYKDALLRLNRNCSCNYVPHLWEHWDMGDIASLIAPRPFWIQSGKEDRLNGPRGIDNVTEQVEIIRRAYRLFGAEDRLLHEICPGGHRWNGENLERNLEKLGNLEN